ncbi:glycoside hydrolase family 1 protein [Globicatella sanguinis]|uniref:glycoside hydrolase family 1 protein n=1 Tax=Globicatella sanguinis TaxID=13076 RepID=UPI000C79E6E6|nr:glycoside hydrolase family 1 protein [Globicatella sanguinis]MDK7630381.1 glycoside hydrolase family 1 protein [Globicatella sanguinis]WIK66309.1 glycoside hydrolase family 1 protein [Globicatella sanguinis]WKT55714.1 glycoside hydrolase family 1 protein [Globicatella sanguinis]
MKEIVSNLRPDFLWGSASAAYQIEGAWNEDGKSPSVWDEYVRIPGTTFKGTTGDVAVDHYHRYKEDVALMAEMGIKAYRFSIAWTRILPNGRGKVNEAGIKFYSDLIDELIKNDIEPLVTLYHWDLPQCLMDEYGGWEDRQIIDDFNEYASVLFERFGDRVKYWISLNEQNVFVSLGYQLAMHPPGVKDTQRMYNVNHIANLANAKVTNTFHEMVPDGKIGPSFAYSPNYAKDSDPINVLAAEKAENLNAYFWMDIYLWGRYPKSALRYLEEQGITLDIQSGDMELLASAKPDFLGINYYQTNTIAFNPIDGVGAGQMNTTGKKGSSGESGVPGHYKRIVNEFVERTNWDWEIDPKGLQVGLQRITSRYDIPVLITENGLGEYDKLTEDGKVHDQYRIDYLQGHVAAMNEAVANGTELLGYCTWSFTDLLSWLNGYQKRYGFVYVDKHEVEEGTLERLKKDSYYWYQELIHTHQTK